MDFDKERESFKSRLGFLLVSAGCAIGIGNVWKFPYITGAYGGAVFVLFYLLFLLLMGIPVLTMELAVGRASRKSAVQAYRVLERKGDMWHIHGWFAVLGNYLLMMFYTSVSGWMLDYFVKFATGRFENVTSEEIPQIFNKMLGDPMEVGIFMAITVIVGAVVCSVGLQKGIERITTLMMLLLLVLIMVLAIHSAALPGGGKGLAFYLLPDWKRAQEMGLKNVAFAAMNQSFFTLSLGIGSMEIFGSYMPKDRTLGGESARICVLDTFVALMAGLIIFPACSAYGVQPDAGPSLIFITLPQVFLHMNGGWLWGTLFFLFMTFASLSTIITVMENIITCSMDNFGMSRRSSSLINGIIILVTSIPCVLGYNLLSGVRFFRGMDILDTESFLVEALLLPIGSLIYLLFCTSRWGWGFDNYLKEANTGAGLKLPWILKPYLQFGLPILILVIFVQGLL